MTTQALTATETSEATAAVRALCEEVETIAAELRSFRSSVEEREAQTDV
jgi:hypothetical protein